MGSDNLQRSEGSRMGKKFQQMGLVAFGAARGVAASLHFSAVADRQSSALMLPVDDLRLFSEVFGRIKSDYVEPVEDRKLLKEAINGMLTGLDPHSAFLDQDAYRDLQVGTQGEFGGLGIEVGAEDGFVKVVAPIEDTPAYRAGIQPGDLIIKLDDVSLKGLVLDLRLNPGGLLNSAVAVSAAFLPKNALVVYTDGRTEDSKMRLTAVKENYVRGAFKDDYLSKLPASAKTIPMVVLVNGA